VVPNISLLAIFFLGKCSRFCGSKQRRLTWFHLNWDIEQKYCEEFKSKKGNCNWPPKLLIVKCLLCRCLGRKSYVHTQDHLLFPITMHDMEQNALDIFLYKRCIHSCVNIFTYEIHDWIWHTECSIHCPFYTASTHCRQLLDHFLWTKVMWQRDREMMSWLLNNETTVSQKVLKISISCFPSF